MNACIRYVCIRMVFVYAYTQQTADENKRINLYAKKLYVHMYEVCMHLCMREKQEAHSSTASLLRF